MLRLQSILLASLLLCCCAWADESSFSSIWIDGSATVTEEALAQTMSDTAAQNPNPDHLIVLIHGFAVTRAGSTAEYGVVSERIHKEFAKQGKSVAIVGIQWDSAVGGFIFSLPGKYHQKTLLARKTGRFGARHTLLELQKHFPNAHLSIMAHSMGCEVAAAATNPTMKFDKVTDSLGSYQPDGDVVLNGMVLCGADLEYDATVRGGTSVNFQHGNLIYMTMSEILGNDRDKILDLRRLLGGRALGSAFPKMSEKQYDAILGTRRIIFDNKRIPLEHFMLKYYSEWRLSRIIPSLICYVDPQAPISEDLAAITEVMDAPKNVDSLAPYLNSENFSASLYATWRLEHLLCGGSEHLADGYLEGLAKVLKSTPRKVLYGREESPCEQVKQGIFPSEKMMERAGAPSWARR